MSVEAAPGPTSLEDAAAVGRSLILRQSGAGLLVVDPDLRIVSVEGEAYRSVESGGVEAGRMVADVVPAAAWEVLEPRYRAALDGHVQAFEYQTTAGDGFHSVRIAPVLEGDTVVGAMALSQDVSAEALAARRVADSDRLQASVLEALEEGVVVVDTVGTLVQANSAAASILGLDPLTARADPEWWTPLAARLASDGSDLNVGAQVMRTGEPVRDVAVEVERLDGVTRTLSLNYQPLRDEAGCTTGLVLSFRDVTDRQREHREAVEIRERLREAHDVAQLASWEWLPETGRVRVVQALSEDQRFEGAQPDLEELLAGVPDDQRELVREDLDSLVRGDREEATRRLCWSGPAGDTWIEARARAVRDHEGRLLHVRGTAQDVTEAELARQQERRARNFFQNTLDSLAAHIAVLGERGDILMTNRPWVEFAAAHDFTPTEVGVNYLAACDAASGDEDAERAARGIRSILSGAETEFSMEYPCHGPDEARWFLLRAARFEGPGEARVVVAHDDVTQRRLAEDQVAAQAALLDEVDVAVVATDAEGRITHWNLGARRLYGWSRSEVLGQVASGLVWPPGVGKGRELLGSSDRWSGEYDMARKDGSLFPAALRGRRMTHADGRFAGWIGVSVDMTERVESERALRAARNYMSAIADSMGEGLYTLDTEGRVTYMNRAAEALLGWEQDEIAGRVMHAITHHRRPDGSDFPIDECPIVNARRDGQTMRVEEDTFITRAGDDLPVAYTAAPFETEDGVEGCVVVFEDATERRARDEVLKGEAEKLATIDRIQDALAQDRFMLYAQPIVDLRDDRVVQNELLLRIREPDGQIVGPGAYLGVAEQYGLIGDIDRWVIQRAMDVAAAGIPVQINLSARSVGEQGILEHIERCLQASGADPSGIVFEVTETALVENQHAARDFAESLHRLGCNVALDDFGTGYGGFTYLKQLPFDFLKIDIEFVRDLTASSASRHVVDAVVALARSFGLLTVAEGVEDAETYALLRELGVDLAQGYHICRPKPLDETDAIET